MIIKQMIAIRYQLFLYCSGAKIPSTNSIKPKNAKRKFKEILKASFNLEDAIPINNAVVTAITMLVTQTLKTLYEVIIPPNSIFAIIMMLPIISIPFFITN